MLLPEERNAPLPQCIQFHIPALFLKSMPCFSKEYNFENLVSGCQMHPCNAENTSTRTKVCWIMLYLGPRRFLQLDITMAFYRISNRVLQCSRSFPAISPRDPCLCILVHAQLTSVGFPVWSVAQELTVVSGSFCSSVFPLLPSNSFFQPAKLLH